MPPSRQTVTGFLFVQKLSPQNCYIYAAAMVTRAAINHLKSSSLTRVAFKSCNRVATPRHIIQRTFYGQPNIYASRNSCKNALTTSL